MAIRWCFTHQIGWYYHTPGPKCRDKPNTSDKARRFVMRLIEKEK